MKMTLKDVMELTGARVLAGEDRLGEEVKTAFGSDLMSDVLAYAKDCSILLTGLANAQAIRTADMLDIGCVLFVRGKMPDEQMLELAREKDMVILQTTNYMFTTCGILYKSGITGGTA